MKSVFIIAVVAVIIIGTITVQEVAAEVVEEVNFGATSSETITTAEEVNFGATSSETITTAEEVNFGATSSETITTAEEVNFGATSSETITTAEEVNFGATSSETITTAEEVNFGATSSETITTAEEVNFGATSSETITTAEEVNFGATSSETITTAEEVASVESTSLIDLDIFMSKTTHDLGDLVNFSISGNDFSGTQNVSVDVTDPTGNTIISRSINISPNISGEIEFRLSENFKTGTYKITATTSDSGQIISEISNFKIQSQFNSFTISGLTLSDQQGNSSTLQVGEMGFIKVNLSSTKSIATLVTVNLFDAELTSIGIGSVQTTLASGESEIILSFMIPDDAAIGPADIYVNAFSDWPSNGGTALTSELASMEDIS